MGDKDWYWDWIKHEGNVFNARGNFFLVAESMLLLAVTALASSSSKPLSLLLFIYIAGAFVTLIWLYVNGKHRKTQTIIVQKLEDSDGRYKDIKVKSRECPWCIANHTMMGFILPLGLLALWITLLIWFRKF